MLSKVIMGRVFAVFFGFFPQLMSQHYSVDFVRWVGLGISKILFGIIICLFYLHDTARIKLKNSGEAKY